MKFRGIDWSSIFSIVAICIQITNNFCKLGLGCYTIGTFLFLPPNQMVFLWKQCDSIDHPPNTKHILFIYSSQSHSMFRIISKSIHRLQHDLNHQALVHHSSRPVVALVYANNTCSCHKRYHYYHNKHYLDHTPCRGCWTIGCHSFRFSGVGLDISWGLCEWGPF